MGCEFSIHLNKSDEPVTSDRLEEILFQISSYHGKSVTNGQIVLEFRGPNTKATLNGPPDVNVGVNILTSGHDVTLCQFGDYDLAAHVLGVLVMELVSESKFERIEVVKP